ncbi:ComC/BlpC family leader-containing pheromone/bacteriocin [Streptococcus downei]|nr:ComC/BlpC family leader-containing pheromone/bacteriocin [Streptococcus downei]
MEFNFDKYEKLTTKNLSIIIGGNWWQAFLNA